MAETFVLADFDSEDVVAELFAVVVTLVDAVDGVEYERLLFDDTGTNIIVSLPYQESEFTISYTMEGSNNYSTYQDVSSGCMSHDCCHGNTLLLTLLPLLTGDQNCQVFQQPVSAQWPGCEESVCQHSRRLCLCDGHSTRLQSLLTVCCRTSGGEHTRLPHGEPPRRVSDRNQLLGNLVLSLYCRRYNVRFSEDGPAVFPLNSSEFTITDEDNIFILQATLSIVNSASLAADVADQLSAPSNEEFQVIAGDGTTTLVIQAIGPRKLVTTHEEFADYLMGVAFTTNDQAPDVVRNLSVVVEEFPLGDAPLSPTYIPIYVIPVNDRPTLLSSQVTEVVLSDYLPQDRQNLGFNASFLLSQDDVADIDRRSSSSEDLIGLAIFGQVVPEGLGVWQYRSDSDSDWMAFPDTLSSCSPLLLDPSKMIRFSPSPSPSTLKEDGDTIIMFQAWDGSSYNSACSTQLDGGT